MICQLCNIKFKVITNTHLKKLHYTGVKEYINKFGREGVGFSLSVVDLLKNDPRYVRWRQSLLLRPTSWAKGHTKETHPSLVKISETFKRKKIDNFAEWRLRMKKLGKIPASYPELNRTKDLAELIGVTLGDGNIHKFPRTEGLTIASNAKNRGFIQRYAELVEKVFRKKATIDKPHGGCVKIRIYQKNLSKRLGIPTGSRIKKKIIVPRWISRSREHSICFLRGLYEAEGSFCVHEPTSTYKMFFSNRNDSLLRIVYRMVTSLGFQANISSYKIQISRKAEVYEFKDLIRFRIYDNI